MTMSMWPAYISTVQDASTLPSHSETPVDADWMNATAVDDLFGFGTTYGRPPPTFEKLPKPNNTVVNSTSWPLTPDALYVLVTSPSLEYMLCSMSASLLTDCSTDYNVSVTGGSLRARCDSDEALGHVLSAPRDIYWAEVASRWATAINLNDGIADGNSSNARLLAQLIPKPDSLDPSLPSIAEALAVLSGCTLLAGAIDSSFTHDWDGIPGHKSFSASLQLQDYASGPAQNWQQILYPVLGAVFAVNLCYLCYFVKHRCLVTDFMEPQNLFTLSLNSPPSQALEGACGGGPEDEDLKIKWTVGRTEEEHFYMSHV